MKTRYMLITLRDASILRYVSMVALLVFGLISFSPASFGYTISLFDNTVYTPDTNALNAVFGLTGDIVVEDFEDATLVSGLNANVTSYFDPRPDHVWDGIHVSTVESPAVFDISSQNIRLFGIGISDNDGGNDRVTINDAVTFNLTGMSGYIVHGQGRASYIVIRAEDMDADITRVAITGSVTPVYDHLVLAPNSNVPEPGVLYLFLSGFIAFRSMPCRARLG